MRMGKSVKNGSNGGSVFSTMVGGTACVIKDSVKVKDLASLGLAPNVVTVPDSEVKLKRRRRHTREYKLSIVKQVEKLKGKPGAIGEFLRKEGLYSATLHLWKKQRNEGILGQTRGRKPAPPEVHEIEKLKKENHKLRTKIGQYQLVIEAQKKISEILGIRQDNVPPMPELDENE